MPNERSKVFPAFSFSICLGVSTVLLFMASDFCYRSFHDISLSRDLSPPLRVESPVYHHGLAPLASKLDGYAGRSALYQTNSLGFRAAGKKIVSLKSNSQRVLFIGDSFTEGIAVAYPDTFVGQIEKAWGIRSIETLNAAAVSYSPIIYYRKVKYLLETVRVKFDELVVFIDPGDIVGENFYRLGEEERVISQSSPWQKAKEVSLASFGMELDQMVENFIDDHFYFSPAGWRKTRSLFRGPFGTGKRAVRWTWNQYEYEHVAREGIRRAYHHMDLLYELTQKYKIPLTVVVYPWPDHIVHGEMDSMAAKIWKDWAVRHHVQFINLFPLFLKENPEIVLKKYYLIYDEHWNESGHALVARTFLEKFSFRHSSADLSDL